jgi:hypothetical protein
MNQERPVPVVEKPGAMVEYLTIQFLERSFGITNFVRSIEDPIQQNVIKLLVFRSMQYFFVQKKLFFSNYATLPLYFKEQAENQIQQIQELAETYLFSLRNRDVTILSVYRDIRELEQQMGIISSNVKTMDWKKIPIIRPILR